MEETFYRIIITGITSGNSPQKVINNLGRHFKTDPINFQSLTKGGQIHVSSNSNQKKAALYQSTFEKIGCQVLVEPLPKQSKISSQKNHPVKYLPAKRTKRNVLNRNCPKCKTLNIYFDNERQDHYCFNCHRYFKNIYATLENKAKREREIREKEIKYKQTIKITDVIMKILASFILLSLCLIFVGDKISWWVTDVSKLLLIIASPIFIYVAIEGGNLDKIKGINQLEKENKRKCIVIRLLAISSLLATIVVSLVVHYVDYNTWAEYRKQDAEFRQKIKEYDYEWFAKRLQSYNVKERTSTASRVADHPNLLEDYKIRELMLKKENYKYLNKDDLLDALEDSLRDEAEQASSFTWSMQKSKYIKGKNSIILYPQGIQWAAAHSVTPESYLGKTKQEIYNEVNSTKTLVLIHESYGQAVRYSGRTTVTGKQPIWNVRVIDRSKGVVSAKKQFEGAELPFSIKVTENTISFITERPNKKTIKRWLKSLKIHQ